MIELENDAEALGRWLRPPARDLDAGEEAAVRVVCGALEPRRAHRRPWWVFATAGAAATVAAIVMLRTMPAPVPLELRDGGEILAAAGDVVVEQDAPAAARVRVVRGTVVFALRGRPERHIEVHAGGIVIRVLGTRFRVVLAGARAAVDVDDGELVIESRGDAPVRVGPGERWEGPAEAPPSAPPVSPAAPTTAVPSAPGLAPIRSPRGGVPRHVAPPAPTGRNRATSLFEAADRARLAGDVTQAERLFDRYRRTHPHAPLAGLAAFQVGRLRLHAGDLRGAREALAHAIALDAGATLRDAAEARLVEVLDRLGDDEACRLARRRYLDRYHQGIHVEEVRARCPDGR